MTTYVLHGGFISKDTERNRALMGRVAELVPEGGTILVVFFASRHAPEEDEVTFRKFSAFIERLANGKKWKYAKATKEHFLEEVRGADCIILRGGSTNTLISALEGYPDLKGAFAGKLVIGSSAGAYALAALGPSHDEGEVLRPGLGLVPVRVACHYGSPELSPHPEAVEYLKGNAQELPLIFLEDGEWQEFSA